MILRNRPGLLLLIGILAFAGPGFAQEQGAWRASSKTAKAITGDLVFSNEKLAINFLAYTIASLRTLTPDELSAAFDADRSALGQGNLYRLRVPANKVFLHKNTLCGTEETEYMATYVQGRTLQIAFFSGEKAPTLTLEALANSSDLCGTYTYTR